MTIRATPHRGNINAQTLHTLADAMAIWNILPDKYWKTADDAQAFTDLLGCPRLSREWTDHAILYDAEFTPAMHYRGARLVVACLLQRRRTDGDPGDILGEEQAS